MSQLTYLMFTRQTLDLSGPGLSPPSGVVPQLDNPPNRNDIAIPVIILCIALSSFFFATRIYSKFLTREFHLRDIVTGLAFAFFWPYIYYSWRLTHTSGYLVHQWDIRLESLSDFLYVTFFGTIFYILAIAFVKTAILLEFTAIFVPQGTRNYFYWTSYVTIAAIILFNAIGLILSNINCSPYEGNWNPLAPGRWCRFEIAQLSVASAVVNFVFDMISLTLPQKVIWGLHTSWKRRIGVSIVFLVGILGCTSALIRLVYTVQFSEAADASYHFSIVALCSLGETTCGVLVLCVPFAPKAITGLQQTRVFISLKSWTASLKSHKDSNSSWPGSNSISKRSGPYQKVELQGLSPVPPHQIPGDLHQNDASITRVTHISVSDEYNTAPTDVNNYYLKQIPRPEGM